MFNAQPPARTRPPAARQFQMWYTCLPEPERFWLDATLETSQLLPSPILKQICELDFVTRYGAVWGGKRFEIFVRTYGYQEVTIEVEGVEVTVLQPIGTWWTNWLDYKRNEEPQSWDCPYSRSTE